MIIGVPKEIKKDEYRVGMVPSGVRSLCRSGGHTILIEKEAGEGSGFSNAEYKEAGANIVASAKEVYTKADLIVKVKEPQECEIALIHADQLVFTYFHFASSRKLTTDLKKTNSICIAYETIELADHSLPLLTPMSEVAGRLAVQEGAEHLEKTQGGQGLLLGGVPGVEPAIVLVIGGGVVGSQAARVAAGMGARVLILDKNVQRLRYLCDTMPANVMPIMASELKIREKAKEADLIILATLVPGAKAPKLITRDMLKIMKKGAVIVDVSIDQGGCCETSHPTTHSDPIYVIDDVIHYCVANMPGAVPRTSTLALTNATLPYVKLLADEGFIKALKKSPSLWTGVNIYKGQITYQSVAETFNMKFSPLEDILASEGVQIQKTEQVQKEGAKT